MSIRIKQERCIGCGQCIDVCPGSLIDRNGHLVARFEPTTSMDEVERAIEAQL